MVVTRRALVRALGVLSGAGATGTVAACSTVDSRAGPESTHNEAVAIDWFNTGDTMSDETQKLAHRFREKHPGVIPAVSLGGQNNDTGYRAKLKTLIASDTAPDVFYLEWIIYPPYVVAGALGDIDSLAKRDKLPLSDLYPAFYKQFTYRGKLWAFTSAMATMVTWYNVDHFQEAGLKPPAKGTTWQQYLDLAQKLTQRQGGDVTRFGTTFWRSLHQPPGALMFAAGGRLFDRPEDPQGSTFHEPPEQEALAWLGDLVNKYRVAPTAAEESAMGANTGDALIFTSGKASMNMRNVIINTFEQKMKDYRWSAAPLPAGKAGQYSVANSHGMCLSASTKKKDAAWEFLGWYGGVEGQTAIAQNNGVPGLRSVAQKSYLTRPEYVEIKNVVLDSLETGRYFPNTTRTNEALGVINPTMAQVFNGQITAREAGDKLHKEVDVILKGG
jgi:multiple sugar transport system substrate-binding protein